MPRSAESSYRRTTPLLPRGRKVKPSLQEVNTKHLLHSHRRPSLAGLRIVGPNQPTQLAPRHYLFDLLQEPHTLSLLRVPLESCHHRQCPLLHAGVTLISTRCEKGELNQSLRS